MTGTENRAPGGKEKKEIGIMTSACICINSKKCQVGFSRTELRNCEKLKVEVAALLPVANSPCGLCGRKATLKEEGWLLSDRSTGLGSHSVTTRFCVEYIYIIVAVMPSYVIRAQELCESRGGRPGLPVPNSKAYGLCQWT